MVGRGLGRGCAKNVFPGNSSRNKERTESEVSSDDHWLENEATSSNSDSAPDFFEIYIGNLSDSLSTREDVLNLFSEFGDIVRCSLRTKEDGYRFGFIRYKTLEQAQAAIKKLHFQPPYNLKVSIGNALLSKMNSSDTSSISSSVTSSNSSDRRQNRRSHVKDVTRNKKHIDDNQPIYSESTDNSFESDGEPDMIIKPACVSCQQIVQCNCGKTYCCLDCQLEDFPHHRRICTFVLRAGKTLEKMCTEKKQDNCKPKQNIEKRNERPKNKNNIPMELNPSKQIFEKNSDSNKVDKFTTEQITEKNHDTNDRFNKLTKFKENLKSRLNISNTNQSKKVSFNNEETSTSSLEQECSEDNLDELLIEDNASTGATINKNSLEIEKEMWQIITELDIGEDINVVVRHVEHPYAWVTDVRNNAIFCYLQQFTNYEANKDNLIKEVAVGSLCLVNHQNEWYRAVITATRPITSARLLESGKIISIKANEKLVEVVDSDLRTEPAFAVKVHLTPGSTTTFIEGNNYFIKPIEQVDDYYEVEVKGHEPKKGSKLKNMIKSPIDFLLPKSEGHLKIEHRFCSNRATVTFETSAIDQLTTDFISANPRQQNRIEIDDFVLAKSALINKEWARGKVVDIIDDKYVVSLCDIGKVIDCKEVYHLPETHIDTPPQSCNLRIIKVISKNYDKYMKFLKKMKYKVMQTKPNIEIICATEDNSEEIFRAEVSPWSVNVGQYGPIINSITIAKTYKKVKIIEIESLNTVYVKKIDKTDSDNYDSLMDDVKNYSGTLKAKPLIALPVKNEMVLGQYSDGNFYRAIVDEVKNANHIRVWYTEFGNREAVSIDKLLELSDELKLQPIFLLKVGLLDVPKEEDVKALAFLAHADQVFTMKVDDQVYPNVKLFYEDGRSFNDEILKVLTGSKVDLINEITFLPIEVGPNANVHVINIDSLKNHGELYVTICNVDKTNILREILYDQHVELFEKFEKTNTSYTPVVNEVCIANFPGDSWNRASCVKVGFGKFINKYLLRNLDCGGTTWLSKNSIRKIEAKYLSKPCVASKLTIEGISKPVEPEQLSVLQKYFAVGREISVFIEKAGYGDYTMKLSAAILREL